MSFLKTLYLLMELGQCLPKTALSREVLLTNQYLGTWYYVGVASMDNEHIKSFEGVDNSVVELKKGDNNTLIMSGALKMEGKCLNMNWTYTNDSDSDFIMTEGPEKHLGVFVDGEWIKCPSCLLVAKFHPNDGFLRIMLFARSKEMPSKLVKDFKSTMDCFNFIETFKFNISPRTKEFCKLAGTK